MDRKRFFDSVRSSLFVGKLTPEQVKGTEFLLDAIEEEGDVGRNHAAYMLATAFHETARTMQPVRETLASSDDQAIRVLDTAFARGRLPWVRKPYWRKDANGRSWLGRGLVQLTHLPNYQKASEKLGVDLVTHPERVMEPEIAARIMENSGRIDVRERLAQVTVPTLITHPRGDVMVPFEQGRHLAAGIPGARFVELDARNHVLAHDEPAWLKFEAAVCEFLGWPRGAPRRRAADLADPGEHLAALTSREREILSLVAGGATNQAIADQLFISEKTVSVHVSNILRKTGAASRVEAAALARRLA